MIILIVLISSIIFLGLCCFMLKYDVSEEFIYFLGLIGTILVLYGIVHFLLFYQEKISCNTYSKTYKTSFDFTTGCYVQINEDILPLRDFEEVIKNKYNNPQKTLNLKEID